VTKCTAPPLSSSSDNRNRLAAASYDSAGDVILKDSVSYTYDAEGKVINGGGTTYTYDGMGERVAKPGKLYWKGVGSTALVETDATDLNPTIYIFFDGARIARRDPGSASPKYYVTDNIGSTSLVTDSIGNVLNDSLFFPYGQERVIANADTGNNYKYTGKERDPETGLDDFGARYYADNIGRFMTPDWSAKATAVPYAKFGDPQTLNLYSYVENAPVNNVDADGHAIAQKPIPWPAANDSALEHLSCVGTAGECIPGDEDGVEAAANSEKEAMGGQATRGQPVLEKPAQQGKCGFFCRLFGGKEKAPTQYFTRVVGMVIPSGQDGATREAWAHYGLFDSKTGKQVRDQTFELSETEVAGPAYATICAGTYKCVSKSLSNVFEDHFEVDFINPSITVDRHFHLSNGEAVSIQGDDGHFHAGESITFSFDTTINRRYLSQ
jgi:RHS repeat-associated protein